MKRVKVGLVGITGYTGMELLRLLSLHPQLIVTRVTSRSEADKKVADIHPFLLNTPLGDLVISKPGGLTTSEVLAKGRPMLVINPIPGQEQRNCETVLEAGAAARLFEVDDAYFKVKSLLADRVHLQHMGERAKAMGHPGAAAAIVADILAK